MKTIFLVLYRYQTAFNISYGSLYTLKFKIEVWNYWTRTNEVSNQLSYLPFWLRVILTCFRNLDVRSVVRRRIRLRLKGLEVMSSEAYGETSLGQTLPIFHKIVNIIALIYIKKQTTKYEICYFLHIFTSIFFIIITWYLSTLNSQFKIFAQFHFNSQFQA